MTDVIVSLRSVTKADGQEDINVFNYKGRYDFKDGKHYVMYDEPSEGVKTVLKASDNEVLISRNGQTQSRMRIVPDRETPSTYFTPHGTIDLSVRGISVDNRFPYDALKFEYSLYYGAGELSKNTIEITLKEV